MVVGGEKLQGETLARQTMEALTRDRLVPSPRNYAVYYHYFCGDVSSLKSAFDAIKTAGAMTQDLCAQLYNKYLSVDEVYIKEAGSAIDDELKKVMELIGATIKGGDHFGENLNEFTDQLKGSASIDVLRAAVEKMTAETNLVVSENRKLHSQLETATKQLQEVRSDFDRVHKEAQIDPLTEVGNRKFFDREIINKIAETRDGQTVLSLLMVDIDHFKNFNDTHGHLLGDQVLRLVARTLVENLKGRDVIARYGGEEFVILLPQTKLADAERVGNQLRNALANKHIRKKGSEETLGIVTVSIGAAEYTPGEEQDALVGRADTALYMAKENGRNRVVCKATDKKQP